MFNDQEEKLYLKILNFISYKPRSAKEVAARLDRFLAKVDAPADLKATLLAKLAEENLINDDEYARDMVFNFEQASKRVSITKLRMNLLKKGIPAEVIDKYISGLAGDLEIPRIKELLSKKINSSAYSKISNPSLKKQKIISYLLGKGFKLSDIMTAIDTLSDLK